MAPSAVALKHLPSGKNISQSFLTNLLHGEQRTRDAANPAFLHRSLLRKPHTVVSASGSYLFFQDGSKILDSCGGAAVAIISHSNEEVTAAVLSQMQKVSYVHTATYTISAAEYLADFLLHDPTSAFQHHLEKAYFVGSGSEANDSAMKMARQYFSRRGSWSARFSC